MFIFVNRLSNDKRSSSSGPSPSSFMRNSSSNQSIKVMTSAKSTSNVRAKSAVLQSSKSLSHGSLDSDPADKNKGGLYEPKLDQIVRYHVTICLVRYHY